MYSANVCQRTTLHVLPLATTILTSIQDLAHSSARALAHYLLPDIAIDRIAELLVQNLQDRRSLVHIALAAPRLYAPCLRVAIRTAKDKGSNLIGSERHDEDTLPNFSEGQALSRRHKNGHLHWYLALVRRAADRAPILLRTTSVLALVLVTSATMPMAAMFALLFIVLDAPYSPLFSEPDRSALLSVFATEA
ncbi:hypothetical protein AMAG_18525, partial [Allomyces macrogynus ATCC 38327]